MLTLALHSPQVHGFFSVPVDHLHALRELAGHFKAEASVGDTVVVSPDLSYAKPAAAFARMLGLPAAAPLRAAEHCRKRERALLR